MDIIGGLIGRGLALMLGAWVGLSTAFFIGFLWHGWQRVKRTPPSPTKSDCPYCKGRGAVIDEFDGWAVCPLCDGERELTAPRELDAG